MHVLNCFIFENVFPEAYRIAKFVKNVSLWMLRKNTQATFFKSFS